MSSIGIFKNVDHVFIAKMVHENPEHAAVLYLEKEQREELAKEELCHKVLEALGYTFSQIQDLHETQFDKERFHVKHKYYPSPSHSRKAAKVFSDTKVLGSAEHATESSPIRTRKEMAKNESNLPSNEEFSFDDLFNSPKSTYFDTYD